MEKIRYYVNELFKNAPKTKKTRELKEELLLDLEDKYNDFISSGKKESEAYNEVISGIGDIDELLNVALINNVEQNELRKKNALVVSVCIGLYIFSLIAAIILDEILNVNDSITGISFFGICGLATCILVYHNMASPSYRKEEDTLVDEFKEWKHHKDKNNVIRKSISSILWTLILIIYFIVSFTTMAWHITWILFIIGGLFEQIITLIFKIKE